MTLHRQVSLSLAVICAAFAAFQSVAPPSAQAEDARQIVQQVVHNELKASEDDHTHWMYLDTETTPSKNTVKIVIETPHGSVYQLLENGGQPLTKAARQQDNARIDSFVNSPDQQATQKKNNQSDDDKATALMKMLPDGFLWTEESVKNGEITLAFKPNPAFNPPTRDARVFAAMAGRMVVNQEQMRLTQLSGTLIHPVLFGWGILGKLQQGGTFNVIRQEVGQHLWKITGTHVHIQGHALIFKSINEQQDEETSNYKRLPDDLTLAQAAEMLKSGKAAQELGVALSGR